MPSTISAGTTAGTAIAVAGDTTGNLAFQTNGTTTAMTIDTSQNVGIGTSIPNTKLHIFGASLSDLRIASNNVSYVNYVDAGFSVQGTTTNHPMVFNTNNTERMRIDSAGRVTMPFQPAFKAEGAGGAQASGQPLTYSVNVFNVGNHYNTGTYTFTAPVAGVYAFQWTVRNVSSGTIYNYITVNNSQRSPAIEISTGSGATHVSAATLLNLNANDAVRILGQGTNNWLDGSDAFSGYLVS